MWGWVCWGEGGCVFRGVGGWVSEFWTSGIVSMLILTVSMNIVCLTQFGLEVDRVSFGKTLFNCNTMGWIGVPSLQK